MLCSKPHCCSEPACNQMSCAAACSILPKESLEKLQKQLSASLPTDERSLLCHHLAAVLAHPPEPSAPPTQRQATVRALEAVACLSEVDGAVPDAVGAAAQRCASAIGEHLTKRAFCLFMIAFVSSQLQARRFHGNDCLPGHIFCS